ncbi:MAG TPA: DUF1707 domain-containing protein [Solirubrobacterales bacterium]|jgi:hypothetical protein|nr:DUF1707 domain-containing protein [Solirubrobacterales bacterium]
MLDRFRKPPGDARVSDLDRERATARAKQLAAEGFIRGDDELQLRLRKIRLAINRQQLEASLVGLDSGNRQLSDGDLRASAADRDDAIRRLKMHCSLGNLSADEELARVGLVEASKTLNDITKVFVDLPALAVSAPSTERRISRQDRDEAVDLLKKASDEGRITGGEYKTAEAQILVARTRSEINAAFRGLSSPAQTAAVKTASNVTKQTAEFTTRIVAEGGRRARKAFLRGVFAVGALIIGVILVIAGIGIAALICFLSAVLLFVSAATALVSSRTST